MSRKTERTEEELAAMDNLADVLGTEMTPVEFSEEEKNEPLDVLKTKGVGSETEGAPEGEQTEDALSTETEDAAEDESGGETIEEAEPTDVDARIRALEQNFTREREGLMREIIKLRRGPSGEGGPERPAQISTSGIPVTVDKDGKAWIAPDVLAQILLPALKMDTTVTMREFLEEQIVSAFEDQPMAETARTELRSAYDALNALTADEQKLLRYGQLSSVDEAVSFIESTSVGRRWRERYPQVATNTEELRTFLRANLLNDARSIKTTFKTYLDRRAPKPKPTNKKATTGAATVSAAARVLAAAKAASPPSKPLPADRARAQATRGRAAGTETRSTDETRLAQLEEMNILEWSDKEREEYRDLVRRIETRKARAS